MPALVEHLRARLGATAVFGLQRVSEHRPENAWRRAEPKILSAPVAGPPSAEDAYGTGLPLSRPLWLLATPEPLAQHRGRPRRQGALEIVDGPERIESGWWDGGDVARDYYVARDSHDSLLWIYRDSGGERQWFLHGIFG
jgi:protein ImuB